MEAASIKQEALDVDIIMIFLWRQGFGTQEGTQKLENGYLGHFF